jgi:hypothetical protein
VDQIGSESRKILPFSPSSVDSDPSPSRSLDFHVVISMFRTVVIQVTDELGMQADSDWNVGDMVHFSFVPIGFGIHSRHTVLFVIVTEFCYVLRQMPCSHDSVLLHGFLDWPTWP